MDIQDIATPAEINAFLIGAGCGTVLLASLLRIRVLRAAVLLTMTLAIGIAYARGGVDQVIAGSNLLLADLSAHPFFLKGLAAGHFLIGLWEVWTRRNSGRRRA